MLPYFRKEHGRGELAETPPFCRRAYELKVSGNRRYSKERKERKLIGQSTSCPWVSGEDDDEEYLQARTIIYIDRGRRGVRNV